MKVRRVEYYKNSHRHKWNVVCSHLSLIYPSSYHVGSNEIPGDNKTLSPSVSCLQCKCYFRFQRTMLTWRSFYIGVQTDLSERKQIPGVLSEVLDNWIPQACLSNCQVNTFLTFQGAMIIFVQPSESIIYIGFLTIIIEWDLKEMIGVYVVCKLRIGVLVHQRGMLFVK